MVNPLLPFIPGFSSCRPRPVVDQTHSTQCPTQESFLIGSWVKAVAVSLFHVLHFKILTVNPVQMLGNFSGIQPCSIADPIPPRLVEAWGFSEKF